MQRWREPQDAGNRGSTAFNLFMEEAMGVIATNLPNLSGRFCEIRLDQKTKAYAATPAILGAFSVSLTGVIDRENKSEIKKIRRALEQLEGEPSEIVDI